MGPVIPPSPFLLTLDFNTHHKAPEQQPAAGQTPAHDLQQQQDEGLPVPRSEQVMDEGFKASPE